MNNETVCKGLYIYNLLYVQVDWVIMALVEFVVYVFTYRWLAFVCVFTSGE